MVQVADQNTAKQDWLSQWQARRQAAQTAQATQAAQRKTSSDTASTTYVPKGREVYDTVSLSDGAKLVNLNRGQDLAKEVRSDKTAETLSDRIKQGSSDIERIGRLFREVFGTVFKQNKA
jgi:hypothetical protein